MPVRHARSWFSAALTAAIAYLIVGLGFAALAGAAGSAHGRFAWRVAAYVVSALVFAAHLAHEHFRLGAPARAAAGHVALGVALGAFGLAVAANVHRHDAAVGHRLGLALVLWPLITAVPALLVALGLATGLARVRRRA